MSKVYRALDKQNGRSVCLKVQLPEKNQAAAARAVQQQRPDEGEIGLQGHPPATSSGRTSTGSRPRASTSS